MQPGPPPAPPGRSFRHRFEAPFFRRILVGGVRHIPLPVQRLTMPMWAGIFYLAVPKARRAVEANLRRVLPDAAATTIHLASYRLFINYSQSIANLYAAYVGRQLPVAPVFSGRETLHAVRAQGRGAIIVTGHLGYWTLAPFLLQKSGIDALVMAMAEEPHRGLQEFEQQFRKQLRVVYTTGSPFASLELASVLRRGEMVGMHIDRITSGGFVMVPFFGHPAPFPIGPATLARATGAPLVPVFMVREGGTGFRSCAEPPIEVARTRDRDADLYQATARLVEVYESYVRRYPLQWFNFHDFWAPPAPLPSSRPGEAAPHSGAPPRERAG